MSLSKMSVPQRFGPNILTNDQRLMQFEAPDGQSFFTYLEGVYVVGRVFAQFGDALQLFDVDQPLRTYFINDRDTVVGRLMVTLLCNQPVRIDIDHYKTDHLSATWVTDRDVGVRRTPDVLQQHKTKSIEVHFRLDKCSVYNMLYAMPGRL
jgi:hypothetical protein